MTYLEGIRLKLYRPHRFRRRRDLCAVFGLCAVCGFERAAHRKIAE
jgi:hypothetical protein